MHCSVKVGARASPLSQAQLWEVHREIQPHFPMLQFEPIWIDTLGDFDKNSSLRHLDKTDFFTREIELMQLAGNIRLSVHSAKDLPRKLREGLCIVAITHGLDPSDSLVFRSGETLHTLPLGAKIATSSIRREEAIKQMRSDAQIIDIRGTIQQRLAKLEAGEVDALVVAECALIRLGLCKLNRIRLENQPAPLQGQLAVVALEQDREMAEIFQKIDSR